MTETNEVGIDEFQQWAKEANTDIMMAVNLGTRGPDEARNLLEYCNMDTDSYYANMRRENGFKEPFNIKTWCLGNEMDGPWQMGHKKAEEYGRIALETAKIMKRMDPDIELVACGSSSYNMPTFGDWELTVLEHTYDYVDYISLHQYYGNRNDDTLDFIGKSVHMDKFIKSVVALCDAIKAKKHAEKTINLSFDEWNVWFHSDNVKHERWQIAPPQLVNVIAPIMTQNGGKAWVQTIFYPYMYASLYGRGTAMKTIVNCDSYKTEYADVPYLETSVVHNEEKREIVLFALNRSLDDDMFVSAAFEGFGECVAVEHTQLYSDDMKAVNGADFENVAPVVLNVDGKKGTLQNITLKKHSWNMIVYKY